ncbi:MAG: HlyC/CorC family transporter [Rhodospirillales bacterium]|nr:HlyC/CorC family transporter [Rhodospirillales bacterium]MCB9995893.1 HlyC/CorC family transporter [Rhodospirillales bacterium]
MTTSFALSVIAIFVLLILSAFFSGSETALTAASKARLHSLAKAGNKRAVLVNKIREKKERMIGALLLGNNLVNILASALATSVLIKVFGEAGVVYATLVMTLLVLIFAEVLPKTYALHFADKMAMFIAPVIHAVTIVLAPVVEMITALVRFVLRLAGVDISMVSAGSHAELLRGVIEMHTGPEEETNEQRAMLRSILDLADVEVCEVMTHRKNVTMIDAAQPVEKIIEELLDSPYTRVPLYRDNQDNIVGIIHVKSMVKEIQAQDGKTDKIDPVALATEPWYIPEATTLFDQLQVFRQRREHFAIVVDEYGSFMGVVTLEDIIEEIVGEIEDEMDEIVAGVRKQPNGTYLVDGDVTIRDLNREFEWDLPDNHYSTVAGLILHEAEMIPEAGQSFNFFGLRFDIVKRQRNQITLVRITPKKKKPAEEAA